MNLPWLFLLAGLSFATLVAGLEDPVEEDDDEGEVIAPCLSPFLFQAPVRARATTCLNNFHSTGLLAG